MAMQILTTGLLAVTALGVAALLLSLSLLYRWHTQRAELEAERDLAYFGQTRAFERGRLHGRGEKEAEWRATPLWRKAHDAALVELLAIVSETDVVRQSGELERVVNS